jgi:hypothetical protein
MPYSVYARDLKTGRKYVLPQRYFGLLPTRADAEIALAWYLETSTASAAKTVDVYIHEHPEVIETITVSGPERQLVGA